MARLFTSGFELGSAFSGMEWSGFAGGAISTTVIRSGGHSYRVSSFASGVSQRGRYQFATTAQNGPIYIREYVRFDTLPSVENRFLVLGDGTDVIANARVYLTIDASGAVRFYDSAGQIGNASTALSTGVWYRVEVMFDRTPGTNLNRLEARIDDVAFASSNSRNLSTGLHHFYVGGNLGQEPNTAGMWFFDDIAINDNQGNFENAWPGDGSVVHLRPNAAGDVNDWSNDYTVVDEVTPNEATDFQSSSTLNATSDHNLDPAPSAINATDRIKVVSAGVRYRGAASANSNFVLRAKFGTGATPTETNPLTPTTTIWRTNDSSGVTFNYKLNFYAHPSNATKPLKKSDLEDLQVGYRISATGTNPVDVSAVWALVEYSSAPSDLMNGRGFLRM